MAAFPEWIAVCKKDIANLRNCRPVAEFVVSINIANRNTGHCLFYFNYIIQKLLFGKVFAVQNFITHGNHIGIAIFCNLDNIGNFGFINVIVVAQPGPYQCF